MESDHAYQLILPTDKRNPSFSLYHCEEQESISVFYGLQLLEVIPDDPEHPTFKMMVGRLANAKVRIASQEDVFNVDRKTIRSWGKAIVSRDLELLARVLLGRAVNLKRTPAIDKYVLRRWPQLRAEGRLDHRAAMAREVEEIFEVTLSGETLRQIINESKSSDSLTVDLVDTDDNAPQAERILNHLDYVKRESTCWVESETTSEHLATDSLESSP